MMRALEVLALLAQGRFGCIEITSKELDVGAHRSAEDRDGRERAELGELVLRLVDELPRCHELPELRVKTTEKREDGRPPEEADPPRRTHSSVHFEMPSGTGVGPQ